MSQPENNWYFVGTDGSQQGPHHLPSLLAMLSAGQITAATLVWSAGMDDWQPFASTFNIIAKTYRGRQEQATELFKKDSLTMATQGYSPTSQSYMPGSYGCGEFIIALLLCFILIGILIFIYMLIVKPNGTLSVTYEYRRVTMAEKICPKCAEQVKAAAKVCRFCHHEFE